MWGWLRAGCFSRGSLGAGRFLDPLGPVTGEFELFGASHSEASPYGAGCRPVRLEGGVLEGGVLEGGVLEGVSWR